jgi:DHA2 family multidrug resistance protein
MISFASGHISGGIGAAPKEFSLAAATYAGAAILMIWRHRWLAEHLSYRSFVRLSLALFVIGAVLCAAAGNTDEFIAGRFVQALGGSAFFTAARTQVNRFEGAERGLAI